MSSTSAAWISGRPMATRSSGMPRMRSASIALLGFDETRISLSLSRSGIPLGCERAQRALQSLLQMIGRFDAREASLHEVAQSFVDGGAVIAIGAERQMNSELLLARFVEGTVEEKVNDSLYIVTKHSCFSFLVSW